MHSHIRFVLATPLILLTAGCANISGAPRSVIPAGQFDQLGTSSIYGVEATLENFYSVNASDRGGRSPRAYRDMVAGMYLAAADANYQRFRSALGSSSRGSAVGFDVVSLLLTGFAASSTGNRAQDLATAATGLTGFRTSFDRNLLFDRAITGIIGAMDAERARTRAQIIERLRGDARSYPLPQFFADIQNYELAATLERGVQRVNELTADELDAANRRVDQALAVCDLDENVGPQVMALVAVVEDTNDTVKWRANLRDAAEELDVTIVETESNDDIWRNIVRALEKDFCTRGARAAAIARILERLSSQ